MERAVTFQSVQRCSLGQRVIAAVWFALILVLFPNIAGAFSVFGPEPFTRSTGKPVTEIRSFPAANPGAEALLQVQVNQVSSAVITLNGAQIFGPNDFNQTVTLLETPVTLLSGNQLTVEVRGQPGGSLTIEITTSGPPVNVEITNPVDSAIVDSDSILVTGTFEGPTNTGIRLNDEVAQVFGDQFFATVPLLTGENILTVSAITQDGRIQTQNLIVFSASPSSFEVRVDPSSGLAPLAVSFTVIDVSGAGIQQIDVNFDGDATIDFTSNDPDAPIENTYDVPGLYLAEVTVTDDSFDSSFSEILPIVVRSPEEADQFFTAIWDGMNDALLNGDVATALTYLNQSAQDRYGPAFEVLLPDFSEIVASYSPLQRVSVSGNLAEYAINRTIDGENRIFLIYFLRGADGVWRLDSM